MIFIVMMINIPILTNTSRFFYILLSLLILQIKYHHHHHHHLIIIIIIIIIINIVVAVVIVIVLTSTELKFKTAIQRNILEGAYVLWCLLPINQQFPAGDILHGLRRQKSNNGDCYYYKEIFNCQFPADQKF